MPLQTLPNQPGDTPEVSAPEAHRVWAGTSAQMVDVREQKEWDEAHIPNTFFIPLGQLMARVDELDKSRPVVTICRSGMRSLNAAEFLIAQGFTEVASMQGGIIAWHQSGYELER